MSKQLFLLVFLCISSLVVYSQGSPTFIQTSTGLTKPIAIVNAGDQSDRLFIAEQAGIIWVITDPSTMQVESIPFMNITSLVDDTENEQGLLGLVFDPQFATNGYFYVNYIVNGPFGDKTRISRFQVDSTKPNTANPNTELTILEYDQPFWNHNGGDLHFGPDGYLYISSGDGGSGNDPQGNGQNTSTLLGAILRINVQGASMATPYTVPATNPFNNEIWLYGLRNPWRFSFDSATGDMYIADVGQTAVEEVSVVLAGVGGLNLGWDCKEGFLTSSGCTGTFHDPIYTYPRSTGRSITGGFVYRGNTFTNFEGWYFFADYVTNQLWQTKGTTAMGLQVNQQSISNVQRISSFGQSESGELYALSHSNGRIYRIIDSDDCPLSLNIPTANSGEYIARQEITSNAVIPGNSTLSYGAQEIILNSNFSVPLTTTFDALIGICGSY